MSEGRRRTTLNPEDFGAVGENRRLREENKRLRAALAEIEVWLGNPVGSRSTMDITTARARIRAALKGGEDAE